MRRREWALLLALGLALPLVVAGLWRAVYAGDAYAIFRTVQVEGVALSTPAPLHGLLLALAARLGLDLPVFALIVSALGWSGGVAAWALAGRAAGRPAFAVSMALLLALHPLQGRVLGLETGLVVGLVGLLAYAAVAGRRILALAALVAMVAAHPQALPFAALLLPLRRGGLPSLATGGVASAAGYALLAGLDGAWASRELALLLVGVQIVAAVAFAALLPRLQAGPFPAAERRALGRAGLILALAVLLLFQTLFLVRDWQLRPDVRLALYGRAAGWLRENALDGETVAATRPGWIAYLAGLPAIELPPSATVQELLPLLEQERPAYCVAPHGVVWQQLQAQPWFQTHYTAIDDYANPYDTASPLTIYRYAPTPFDAGEIISSTALFTSPGGERVMLAGYRLSRRRIDPEDPLYLTLFWQPQTPVYQQLRTYVRLLDPQSGQVWVEVERTAPGGLRTDRWNEGMHLSDRYTLELPPPLPLGDYVLEVALHAPNGRPLPAIVGGQETGTSHTLARVNHPPTVSSTPLQADHPLSFTLGNHIALTGYDVDGRVAPGGTLRVALYWRALQPIPLDYKVFIHLQAPDGQVLAQDDAMPVEWTHPTSAWQPGDTVRDTHRIPLDPSLPRGDYRLLVGLYDPATGERLVAHDTQGNEVGDRVFLQQVQVR